MTPEEIFQALQAKLGEAAVFDLHPVSAKDRDAWFQVAPGELEEVCLHLRDAPELDCDSLECITGVDYPDLKKIAVVYHIYSYAKKHRIVLKAFLDRDSPALPTLVDVWSSANWQERECFDLLGVRFEGHPDLRRLLLPDDWEGHPLRKDWQEKAEYHGIPTQRPNPVELFKIKLPKKEAEAS
ncbi:NADH dehydrogenase subunit C [Sorangium cellulosum]|uniref:NADH-quinone oxidoreductase subunit C n=1 Tax=Sorangium cellulosum TaxID=56 RepID=A0A4V0NEW8_SORCE|nr:NADH-quinone oxidoreductase subunit C [Sorangium cellulosum]AUX27622.1 NADH dehydrogenase subunit C [Sorangium cellulosum]